MLVCHCHCVTERAIREAVRAGADSAAAVGSLCGAATACGGCRDLVEIIVETEREAPARSRRHCAVVMG
jgi:bacterioferritin-associated ferredoxin